MIVVAVKRVELLYRPDTTLHQGKPQTWVCFVSALGLLCISFGFAQGQVCPPPPKQMQSRPRVDTESRPGVWFGSAFCKGLSGQYCRVKGQRSIKVVVAPRGEMGSNEGSQEKTGSVEDVYGVAHVVRKQDHG